MQLTVNKKNATIIDSQVVRDILNIYAEEELFERPVFKDAFDNDSIEFKDLSSESEKILIPWQLFFLDGANLKKDLDHIHKTRIDKVSPKLIAKRRGIGSITSKRIIDRLIRLQNFICAIPNITTNTFCGSLIGKSETDAVAHTISYFAIDLNKFRTYKSKASALEYIIRQIETKNINISQGVLANKMLPAWQVVKNAIYKNTSGFVIKDDKIPFVFLPSEINPEETDGRQIYTLIYLITLIGLNEYNFFIERDFTAKAITAKGKQAKIYRITSDLLLPKTDTEKFRGQDITPEIRDDLSFRYKITPTAVLVTLRIRRIITSKEKYEALLPPEYVPPKNKIKTHAPSIETSVRKFCGKYSFDLVNGAIQNGSIKNVQAQYLLFGAVNKKGYKKYRANLKI